MARITWSVRSGMAGLTMRYRAEVSGACWKAKGPEARDHRCRKKRDGETATTEAERKKGGSEKDADKPRRCNTKSDKDRGATETREREKRREKDIPGDNYCRQREILFSMPGTARMHE